MTTDPKWQTIARKSGKPRALVIAIFTHLMLEANEADDRGSVADVNIEDVASAMDCDEEDVSAVLDAMQERVIVDGRLAGWERRQPKREDIGNPTTGAKSNTERSREHRKRKHDATQGNACNDDATQGNAPEAEAEAEAEAEKSKGAAAASPPRERVREAPPAAPPAKTEISEAPAEPPAAIPDEAPKRATQLAVLLRRNGADPRTVPNDRRIVAWARDGVSDAEALQALETAKARRKATGSDQPIGTAYLAPIVAAIRASPAGVLPSRNRSRQDRYAEEAAQIQAMARWADEELSKGSANAPLARIAG